MSIDAPFACLLLLASVMGCGRIGYGAIDGATDSAAGDSAVLDSRVSDAPAADVMGDALTSTIFETLAPSLLAHWPLDGDARDASGRGFHGTIVGAGIEFGPGQVAQAARFDGTGSWIELDPPEWFADDYTAIVWFRARPTADRQILLNREARPRGPIHIWVADDRLNTNIRDADGVGSGGFIDGNFVDDVWHHVAVVRRGADGGVVEVDLFLDGEVADQGTNTLSTTSVLDAPFKMGYRLSDDPRPLLGALDDVRIYDRALTADEVRAAYDATR